MSLLDSIQSPEDLRRLKPESLRQVVEEVRERHIDVVSEKGGHFGASLGVAELTVALHYAFDTPRAQLVWDTGHQAYIHKILTGRNAELPTIRTRGGSRRSCGVTSRSTTPSGRDTPPRRSRPPGAWPWAGT